MVSPQNPDPAVAQNVGTTGRGFAPAEEARTEVYPGGVRGLVLYRSHISWSAVIAGSVLSISLLLFASSLAYALGIPAFAGGAYGAGAFIWSIITASIAFFCGGCLAAYLVPTEDRNHDMLHGVMSWALALPLILLFFGSVGFINRTGLFVTQFSRLTGGEGTAATEIGNLTAAAWGSWLSLALGLVFAAIGGSVAQNMVSRTDRVRR